MKEFMKDIIKIIAVIIAACLLASAIFTMMTRPSFSVNEALPYNYELFVKNDGIFKEYRIYSVVDQSPKSITIVNVYGRQHTYHGDYIEVVRHVDTE